MTRRASAIALIAAGVILRILTLTVPGTNDMNRWKTWAFHGATQPLASLYGTDCCSGSQVRRGDLGRRPQLHYGPHASAVDYPPLAVLELTAIGSLYGAATGGSFPDDPWFSAAIRIAICGAELGFVALAWLVATRLGSVTRGLWTAALYLGNPATILSTSLGYLDACFVLPLAASLVSAVAARPVLSGAFLGAALMTKPQAVIVAPVIALALWNASRPGERVGLFSRAGAAVLVVCLLCAAPFVIGGATYGMGRAVFSIAHQRALSAHAANIWWLAAFEIRTIWHAPQIGLGAALRAPMHILPIARTSHRALLDPRLLGGVATSMFAARAIYLGRKLRDLSGLAALGGVIVHGYFTLAVPVHENHLFAAVPFLVLATIQRPRLLGMLALISSIAALNEYLFYGLTGVAEPALRAATIIDASVLLAGCNCVALVRHAFVFRRECAA